MRFPSRKTKRAAGFLADEKRWRRIEQVASAAQQALHIHSPIA
jgi:hypothetical protein